MYIMANLKNNSFVLKAFSFYLKGQNIFTWPASYLHDDSDDGLFAVVYFLAISFAHFLRKKCE